MWETSTQMSQDSFREVQAWVSCPCPFIHILFPLHPCLYQSSSVCLSKSKSGGRSSQLTMCFLTFERVCVWLLLSKVSKSEVLSPLLRFLCISTLVKQVHSPLESHGDVINSRSLQIHWIFNLVLTYPQHWLTVRQK